MRAAARVPTLLAAAALAGVGLAGPAAADGVPYTDPAQVGYIGFCDAQGHSITSGSLDAIPFVALAVGSTAAPAPYSGAGRVAFLDAYQPREGVTPAEWSGEELIATSRYTNPAHPMVAGTRGDISMRQFVGDFPPAWDGLVQLRLYLKTPDLPYDPLHYAATDIQVQGDTWHVARGGSVACDSGKATSLTTILAPSAAAGKYNSAPRRSNRPAGAAASQTGTAGATDQSDSGGSSTPAIADPLPTGSAGAAATGAASSGSSFPVGYVVLGGLVAVLAIALLATQRRRLQQLFGPRRGT